MMTNSLYKYGYLQRVMMFEAIIFDDQGELGPTIHKLLSTAIYNYSKL